MPTASTANLHLPVFVTPLGSRVVATARLGKGSFGTAYKVRVTDKRGGTEMLCMKVVKFDYKSSQEREWALDEVRAMRQIRHENIVRLHTHWFNDAGRLCILMELCEHGNLQMVIKKHKDMGRRLTEMKVTHYMQELAAALAYLHGELHMMHRDLKPENILVDEFGTLKLTDFGLAKSNPNALFHTMVGTQLFMAPEQISMFGDGYSLAADVWALGCILYELMALRSPWLDGTEAPNIAAQLVKQRIRRCSVDWDVVKHYSPKLIDVVGWTLEPDPSSRATAQQLVHLLEMGSRPSCGAERTVSVDADVGTDVGTDADGTTDDGTATPEQDVEGAVRAIQTSFRRSFARRARREQRAARRRAEADAPEPRLAWQADAPPAAEGRDVALAMRALQQASEATLALELDTQRVVADQYARAKKAGVDVVLPDANEDAVRMKAAAQLIQMQIRNSFERAAPSQAKAAKADDHARRQQRLKDLATPRTRSRFAQPLPPYMPRMPIPPAPRNWRCAW